MIIFAIWHPYYSFSLVKTCVVDTVQQYVQKIKNDLLILIWIMSLCQFIFIYIVYFHWRRLNSLIVWRKLNINECQLAQWYDSYLNHFLHIFVVLLYCINNARFDKSKRIIWMLNGINVITVYSENCNINFIQSTLLCFILCVCLCWHRLHTFTVMYNIKKF